MPEPEHVRLVLTGGWEYVFRAFFAPPPLINSIGLSLDAGFGFRSSLFRLVQLNCGVGRIPSLDVSAN